MSVDIPEKESVQTDKRKKQHGGPWLMILLIIFIILFLLTSIVLGARLFERTTRDQHTVDLGLDSPSGDVELFRIQYENEQGEVTVRGVSGEDVVAPGTSMDYDVRLRNNDDVIIDFSMTPEVEFLTDDAVPIEFKLQDAYGNYILGSDTQWAAADGMNGLTHKGTIHPGEVYTYHISWQWVFEADAQQNAQDTYLGSQSGENVPGVRVGLTTEATANPAAPKSNIHMAHLLGQGFGCCWCCYLVWLLLLICVILLIRVWSLRRKLNKQIDTLREYEEVLQKAGLLRNGELVKGPNG